MTSEEKKELDALSEEVVGQMYDYDDALPDTGDGERTLLPAGNYHFKVLKMMRGRQEGGKVAGARNASLTVKFTSDSGDEATFDELLILHEKTIYKVRQFFRAIGQNVVKGEPFRPDWSSVVGAKGDAELEVNTFTSKKDGKEYQNNRVKRWLEPAEDFEDF